MYTPMNVVLVEPQIPQNTGNIARLCAATGTPLHLVGRLGFRTDDRHLKRAGLDYWNLLDLSYHESFEKFERMFAGRGAFHILTTKGARLYTEVSYGSGDFLIFGSETRGVAGEIRERYRDNCLRIPMVNEARSLNLATSVGIVLYEALRQNGFFSCPPSP